MTDNEIIKALECCQIDDCKSCPLSNYDGCKSLLFDGDIVIDLINRQKAEIEKLNVELVGMRGACESYKIHYDNAQAEIENLKRKSTLISDCKIWTVRGNATVLTETPEDYDQFKRNIEIEAIKEYKEKVKAILMDKGIYPVVVKNALNEAEKEVITNERHT